MYFGCKHTGYTHFFWLNFIQNSCIALAAATVVYVFISVCLYIYIRRFFLFYYGDVFDVVGTVPGITFPEEVMFIMIQHNKNKSTARIKTTGCIRLSFYISIKFFTKNIKTIFIRKYINSNVLSPFTYL